MGTATSPPVDNTSRRSVLMSRLFSDLQVARYNELYYQRRAAIFRRWLLAGNVVSALAASAVLANLLSGAESSWGPIAWSLLTGLAAISAAVGPVFGLGTKASQLDKAALGHGIVKDGIRRLLKDLKLSELQESHLARNQEIEAFRSALAALDESPSDRMRNRCWEDTMSEMPSKQAWSLV